VVGGPKKTPPSIGPSHYTTFDEFWQREDELWELSLKESIRQKKERIKKLNEKDVSNMQARIRDNKIPKD
jgi:DNA-binding transcriptional regulator GbsR (MarR family)